MSGPIGAGAGIATSAPAPAAKKYRSPTSKELKDLTKIFGIQSTRLITEKDADRALAWLQERPDLSVEWYYDEKKEGPVGYHNPRFFFDSVEESILGIVFLKELIPVTHPIVDEVVCRGTDFTTKDKNGNSILSIMENLINYWNSRGYGGEKEWFHDNFRAKYELAKNPEALKERCKHKYMRSGVKNVASLQLASKTGLPLPEGPLSIITGMLTGKPGNTAQQMASAKKNLYFHSEAASSSSSSSSSAAPAPAPVSAPAPAVAASTTRRRRRRRWYGAVSKKGGRSTRRHLLHK